MATDAKNPLVDDSTSEKNSGPTIDVPAGALSAVRSFVGEHGGSGKVVIQPVGRAGTRVTMVGADGILGDQVVESPAVARALVEAADNLTESEWDRELVSSVNPAPGHYRKMAGWVARQTHFPKARNASMEK